MRHMRNKHRDILYSIISDEKPDKKTLPVSTVVLNSTSTADVDDDGNGVVEEFEVIELKSERFADDYPAASIKPDLDVVAELIKPLSDADLTDNICRLLNYLVDEPTLTGLGWPSVGCEDVLSEVIQQCMYFLYILFLIKIFFKLLIMILRWAITGGLQYLSRLCD